jgi:aspartate-semialdehyde dehydrogenase
VENCHGESINIEFENDFDLDEVKNILKNSKGVKLYDDPQNNIYPLASIANGTDEVYVGRLRRDFSQENTLNLWCVADNIRKGAASNAIQIMEEILKNN